MFHIELLAITTRLVLLSFVFLIKISLAILYIFLRRLTILQLVVSAFTSFIYLPFLLLARHFSPLPIPSTCLLLVPSTRPLSLPLLTALIVTVILSFPGLSFKTMTFILPIWFSTSIILLRLSLLFPIITPTHTLYWLPLPKSRQLILLWFPHSLPALSP